MYAKRSGRGRWFHGLALAAVALAPLAAVPPLALAADQPEVRLVGCKPQSLDSRFSVKSAAALPESADESASDEQQPTITGSIALPGVNEDDSTAIAAAIAAKGLTTITPEAATDAAKGALGDTAQRKFKKATLETENAQAIWAIESALIDKNSGVNPSLGVKVDAGNGTILSVECD